MVKKESWYLGDTYFTSIGQYSMQVTPIQMARATAAVKAAGIPTVMCEVTMVASTYTKLEGKEANQAIGYLEDGTMVVVSDGKRALGQTVKVYVTSALQTQAGRMIFAKMDRQ